MKISVCVGTVRPTTVGAMLASLRRQTWTDWELLLIGQGDDPALAALGTAEAARDPRVRYLHLRRMGLSVARNAAATAATGEVLAFLDDDCEAREDWLATLAACFAAEPAVGLVGGALLKPPPARRGLATCPALSPAEALYDPVATPRAAPPGWDWVGANFALRRAVYERIGPFDECLGAGTSLPAGEDTDYKLRLEAAGIPMRSTPRAVVTHTYGHRYGLGALLRHSRNYATGNGALGAKLTLQGDARGQEWVQTVRGEWRALLRRGRLHAVPMSLLRRRSFLAAYGHCLAEFYLERGRAVLAARSLPVPTPAQHPVAAGSHG